MKNATKKPDTDSTLLDFDLRGPYHKIKVLNDTTVLLFVITFISYFASKYYFPVIGMQM